MAIDGNTELRAVLDGLGQGLLIFSGDGRLIMDNLAARTVLGTDLNLLRTEGWNAASILFNTRQTTPDETLEAVRDRAVQSPRPVRFRVFRSGEYLPCWMAIINDPAGDVFTMITLDATDWGFLTQLFSQFRDELSDSITSTLGHAALISASVERHNPADPVDVLTRRIGGFTRLIGVHMERANRLLTMLERLEMVRTGRVRDTVRQRRRRVRLDDFFEDLLESLDEIHLLDPETDGGDQRGRINVDVPASLAVQASPAHLTQILHDVLRNAIMYSVKDSPVRVTVQVQGQFVQVSVADEGCGIRESEHERVFEAFQRARQPQVISEFGYGLSLHLCKHEIEAMNGRIWFESEEGVGTTFCFMLPAWTPGSSSKSES
jgi:signal transduction histidine kinase